MENAVHEVRKWPQKKVRIFHHNDSDGLTSGAILITAFEMKKALEDHNLEKVGRIMTANHKILIEMDLSHETLIYLCDRAIALGALGAKVTGGGRGGYMSALTPGKDLQEAVAKSFEDEGYKVIRATIGGS